MRRFSEDDEREFRNIFQSVSVEELALYVKRIEMEIYYKKSMLDFFRRFLREKRGDKYVRF
jgi:hypothetical protein